MAYLISVLMWYEGPEKRVSNPKNPVLRPERPILTSIDPFDWRLVGRNYTDSSPGVKQPNWDSSPPAEAGQFGGKPT